MAKSSKPKFDFKALLLKRGEHIVLGVAGLFLAILLISGVSKWANANVNPDEIAKKLSSQASTVHSKIKGTDINPEDLKKTQPPEWLVKSNSFQPVPVQSFPITGPQFDPIAKPDTKKDNPKVLELGNYQVDLIRYPFKAFDIVSSPDGTLTIAVIADKAVSKMDEDAKNKLKDNFAKRKAPKPAADPMNPPPGDPGAVNGPGGFGPQGPGGPGAPGGPGGRGPGGRGGPPGRNNFNINAQRSTEKAISYVPVDELDKAIADGKAPAMTVIPLRGALIHMEIPYKQQIEEVKRALRLTSAADARAWTIYDGYEVQRKETVYGPDGTIDKELSSDWKDYNFEEQYQERINARKMADTFEDPYLSLFLRYDMALALPLPQLVSELGAYPPIRLENIVGSIRKLKESGKAKVSPSEMAERLRGVTPRRDIYKQVNGSENGTGSLYQGLNAPGSGPPKKGSGPANATGKGPMTYTPGVSDPSNTNALAPDELETLLLRFIDVNVEPGVTYQYRVRLRMLNPNYKKTAEVTNPAFAEPEVLKGPWVEIGDKITIPAEQHMYAADLVKYREGIEKLYPKEIERKRLKLELKDDQAVIEICKWLAEVRPDAGKREPVGAWIVADIPVGRGEYIGRKQYVRLPLWSSEAQAYVLREINTTAKTTTAQQHPKGWLVDFSTPPLDVLVDYEGGRVLTTRGGKTVTEDVGTELLILTGDGKLIVRKSLADESNGERKAIVNVWSKWLALVESRKAETTDSPTGPNNFAPRPGGP